MTLPEQLAAAEAAAAAPRERVAALSQHLQAAIKAEQFDQAAILRAELHDARAELVVAEAAVHALREGAAAADREHDEIDRQIQIAGQRARAGQDLARAQDAERHGLAELDSAIDRMFDLLAQAQAELRAALGAEHSVGAARQRAAVARDAASEAPTGLLPKIIAPNKASLLAEQDPLVSVLARWSR
jgi:hypothetical protein